MPEPARRVGGPGATGRLFIALLPDDMVRLRLVAATRLLDAGGRAVPAANLHLTMAFLGNVALSRAADASRAMHDAGPLPFDVLLDRFGEFRKPGLVWLGPQAQPAMLQVLHRRLTVRLRDAGFDLEAREFRPHVTLAREAALPAAVPPVAVPWRVRQLGLLRSIAVPGGVRYEEVDVIDFGGA